MIRSMPWEDQPGSRHRDGWWPGRWEKEPEAGGRPPQQCRGHLEKAANTGGDKAGRVGTQTPASHYSCLSS